MKSELPKPKYRAIVYGVGRGCRPVMLTNPPAEAWECGMYVHIDDFEDFKAEMKKFEAERKAEGQEK